MVVTPDRGRIIVLVDEPVTDSEQREQQIVVLTHWLEGYCQVGSADHKI